MPMGGFVPPKPRPRAQARAQPSDEMGWGEEGEKEEMWWPEEIEMGWDGMGGDETGRGGTGRYGWGVDQAVNLVRDGVGQQVVSCRGRAGFYLCGQVLCSGCVVRCHECEGRDIQREAMGWAENVDGVLVGMGVQEVTVGLEAEQEALRGDGTRRGWGRW